MRLFIAALIPEEVQKELSNKINTLKTEIDGVKWEKQDKLHITLKFLGSVDESQVEEICSLIGQLTPKYSPFKFSLSEIGAFPSLKNPKVLYMGLTPNNKFSKFQNILENTLSEIGFEKENRKFTPHITLGRAKKKINLRRVPIVRRKEFEIVEIGLIKSELRSEGSFYTTITTFRL